MLYEFITDLDEALSDIAQSRVPVFYLVDSFGSIVITSYSIHYTKLYDYNKTIDNWLRLLARASLFLTLYLIDFPILVSNHSLKFGLA